MNSAGIQKTIKEFTKYPDEPKKACQTLWYYQLRDSCSIVRQELRFNKSTEQNQA